MHTRASTRSSCRLVACSVYLLAVAIAAWAAPGAAQSALTVNGTLVITGGGTNTSTVRYTGITFSAGSGTTTIQLSPAYNTLVIRGPQGYATACNSAADCWDSDLCVEKTAAGPGLCGWSGRELPPTCTGTGPLNLKLDDCAALVAKGKRDGPFAEMAARTDQCISAANQVATLGAACPTQAYVDGYDKVVFDAMAASYGLLQVSGTSLVTSDVWSHLKRIGAWYDGYKLLNPTPAGATEPNSRLAAQASRVLGDFWKAAYARVGVPAAGAANPSDALLDDLFRRGVEVDRVVLAAAFTAPAPIQTAPLVELMGDALESTSARLVQVGQYHDLACRFRYDPAVAQNACANDRVITEVGELTRLLAAVGSASELNGVLARTASPSIPVGASTNWPGWRAVFASLFAQQAAFEASVLDALPGVGVYDPGLVAPRAPAGSAPPSPTHASTPLLGLARVVQEARVRANSYQATGLFDSRYQGILRAGIHQDRVNEVIGRVESRTNDLLTQATTFNSNRLTLANTVLQQMVNLGSQQKVVDEITQRLEREQQLMQDLAGLRTAIEVQEARFGDFMQAYNALSEIAASKPETAVTHFTASTMVRAANAAWSQADPASADPLSTFSAAPPLSPSGSWPLQVSKGTILNISSTGKWSPNCATKVAQFTNPLTGQPDRFTVPEPALTGPEGYLLSLAGSTFTATTNQSVHTVDHYDNYGSSHKECGGAGLTFGLNLGPVSLGNLAHGSAEWCWGTDHGTRTSDITSNGVSSGNDSRVSAAFTTGLRVAGTPFPEFPAGSLLLLEVARGGTTRAAIRDVHVVQQPYTSALMSDDADLYLVVNDVHDATQCAAPAPDALTLSLTTVVPFGTVARELGSGMATALANLRQQQSLLLEQGRVGPQQMASLRDQAFVDLSFACGTGCVAINHYPAEVLKLFDAWVGKELATVERKVDARTLERELVLVKLQHAALAKDLTGLGEQARLLSLIPTWLLKDLDTQLLESNTRSLLELLVADLYPIVDLRRPDTLQYLDSSLLNALLSRAPAQGVVLDWTSSLVRWTNAAGQASQNIVARLRDQLGNSPLLNDRIVALGIPRPGYASTGGSWQRVTPDRAAAIWAAIEDPAAQLVSLSIQPSDLYALAPGATDVLLCNESVPVVTAMVLYMVRPGQPEEFPGLLVPVSWDRNLHFPDVGSVKNYRIDNGDWINQGVALLAGDAVIAGAPGMRDKVIAATADNATPLYRTGNGLSPFGQFDIPTAWLRTTIGSAAPTDFATEMVVAFRVKSRNVLNVGLDPMCP